MASICAKVTRDERMKNIADIQYPIYNFKQHKGYWTLKHRNLIKENWACELHRQLFLRKLYGLS
jgi:ribonuclease HII